jgi:hypothetical protein
MGFGKVGTEVALLGRGEIGEKKRGEKEKHGNQCMNLD